MENRLISPGGEFSVDSIHLANNGYVPMDFSAQLGRTFSNCTRREGGFIKLNLCLKRSTCKVNKPTKIYSSGTDACAWLLHKTGSQQQHAMRERFRRRMSLKLVDRLATTGASDEKRNLTIQSLNSTLAELPPPVCIKVFEQFVYCAQIL